MGLSQGTMPRISIRCYAELNDFLPPPQAFVTFRLSLSHHTRLKNLTNKIR